MRCSRCVLSDKYPRIFFDENGVCNYCNSFYKQIGYKGEPDFKLLENKLIKIFNKTKDTDHYNCLVPLSGGKDSTYILYLCVKKYKLKALAFTFDNGFLTDIGRQNIHNAVDLLGVDHIFIKPAWQNMKIAYRVMFENYGISCVFCDHCIFYISRYIQNKFGIPLIVLGGSPRTQGKPSPLLYRIDSETVLTAFKKSALESFYFNEFPWFKFTKKDKNHLGIIDVDRISLPYYLDWNENKIAQVLASELKWKRNKCTSEHVDCEIAKIKDYMANRIWGFPWKEIKYSDLIRDNQMTRDEALDLLEDEAKTLEMEPEYFPEYLMKLEYSKSQFTKILKKIGKCPFAEIKK